MIRKLFNLLKKDERGVSALEYAILAGVIVVVVVTALGTFSGKIEDLFDRAGTKLDSVAEATTGTGG
ncbi:Flp family type IVb pilin [Brenneria goodwinii]|uniref:Flp family type IVb pilin n=1 Tax=Brenneria goodwinii TaxID=1109412 RepID=UPI0036EF1241